MLHLVVEMLKEKIPAEDAPRVLVYANLKIAINQPIGLEVIIIFSKGVNELFSDLMTKHPHQTSHIEQSWGAFEHVTVLNIFSHYSGQHILCNTYSVIQQD